LGSLASDQSSGLDDSGILTNPYAFSWTDVSPNPMPRPFDSSNHIIPSRVFDWLMTEQASSQPCALPLRIRYRLSRPGGRTPGLLNCDKGIAEKSSPMLGGRAQSRCRWSPGTSGIMGTATDPSAEPVRHGRILPVVSLL
jgi:hypothetical protein